MIDNAARCRSGVSYFLKNAAITASLLLVFLGFGPVSAATEKPGAQVVVTTKTGPVLAGELLAVKKDFLVLSLRGTNKVSEESIAVANIREVKVVRPSTVQLGAVIGLLIGVGGGACIGYSQGDDPPGFMSRSRTQKAETTAFILGFLGLVAGSALGAMAGSDTSFRLENKPENEVHWTLVRLGLLARIKGIQI